MNKNIISSLLIALAFSIGFSSCEDVLQANNERHGDINAVVSDTLYGYWGILKSLQNIGERYVILGECRGDLVAGTEYISDSIHAILDFDKAGTADGSNRYLRVSDYYHVINSCNAFIANCDTLLKDGRNNQVMIKEYAQVCAIRAWVYLQLVQVYGEVPYFTNPMTSTAEMEDFWANSGATVNAGNLKDKDVVTKLIEVRSTPIPNYGDYGQTKKICHSTQCVFPANLVLGDIFLLEGSKASCTQAAQYYYDFLNSTYGGTLPTTMYCGAFRDRQTSEYNYSNYSWLEMFNTNKAVSDAEEVVTVIPSSTNKLWGTVQHGVNELFGFTPNISVATTGADTASTTTATIRLVRNYKHELVLSSAYKQLAKSQDFETYVGADATKQIKILEDCGDARLYATAETSRNDEGDPIEFVMKQNPGGNYSTTFPVIYRKGNIWLRFAEAVNRAGFPSYAFAILKSGMVDNTNWVPSDSTDYIDEAAHWTYSYTQTLEDGTEETVVLNEKDAETLVLKILSDSLITDSMEAVAAIKFMPDTYTSWPNEGKNTIVCKHISVQEMHKAKSTPWLQFETKYFQGSTNIPISANNTEYEFRTSSYSLGSNSRVTNGIHWRGCGLIPFNDRNTSYNYVNQVNKMLFAYENLTDSLSRENIYDPANEELVITAIEDLICDEMALETGVEGNRFFDLIRMARHRGDNDFLASRVARRSGTMDAAMRSKLLNEKNWYLPLPVKK